jgi:N-acetylglucosaminyldiphosphoundecaprenol N-acetyl-beta-D-mannosaminyltransferase
MAWLGIFAGSLAISACVTFLVCRAAVAANVLDHPRETRKVHVKPVPRLGGIGIVAAVYGTLSAGALLVPQLREAILRESSAFYALAIGGIAIAGLGLYDDLYGANARKKLTIQCAVALLLYGTGSRIVQVENPFGPDVALGVLSLPVTLLWIVGVTNAVNLIDGLDGLAAGIGVAAASALAVISAQAGNAPATFIAIAAVGALIGFLFFNVNPASIFMGDTGSLFLGALLAVLGLLPRAGTGKTPLVALAVVLAIPIADTVLAMARRFARGAPIFSADREHLHHRLIDQGFSQRQAVLALWTGAGVLAAAGMHLASRAPARGFVLAPLIVAGGLALHSARMFQFLGEPLRRRGLRSSLPVAAVATDTAPAMARPTDAHGVPRTDVLGYRVTACTAEACVGSVLRWMREGVRCRWVACINPHSYVVALKDRRFREALQAADSLLPDGAGIVLAARLLERPIRRRVTGSDLFRGVMEAANLRGGARVFFLGSTDETLATIREKVRAEFPRTIVAGTYAPPFTPEFTPVETDAMIHAVNAARADVLWVGMTAPKQEVWLHENCKRLRVKAAGAIGAVFDFYAGRVKRSPLVFQELGLEWLPRLVQQPRRLWKRTFVSAPVFLWHLAKCVAMSHLRAPAAPDTAVSYAHRLERKFPGAASAQSSGSAPSFARRLSDEQRREGVTAARVRTFAAEMRDQDASSAPPP